MITESDKTRISDGIRHAEMRTAGEIFCIVVRHSSEYRLVPIAWASALALFAPLPLIFLTVWSVSVIYLLQLIFFVLVASTLSHPKLRFHVVPKRAKHDRAHAEALRQFFAQGLNNTEHRTGVLIFVSTDERYAEIVADAGINEKVEPQVWDDAVAALIAAIKSGNPANGFLAAIEQCGAVLAEHFPPGSLKRNELPDKLVVM
jgi:putative membrane protein